MWFLALYADFTQQTNSLSTLRPMSTHSLLMIEDDVRLADMVSDYLGKNGLSVTHCADASSGWPICRAAVPCRIC